MKLRRELVINLLTFIRDGYEIPEVSRRRVCDGLIRMVRGETFNQAFGGRTAGRARSKTWEKAGLEYAVRLRLKQRPGVALKIIGDRLHREPEDVRATLQPHRNADEARLTAILDTVEWFGHDRDMALRDMLAKWFAG